MKDDIRFLIRDLKTRKIYNFSAMKIMIMNNIFF